MDDALVFGWRTALLLVAVAQLLLIAAALTRPLTNRVANRTLALLLLVLAGILTPWMIGFAGFYDRWQWLSFAPFSITLAVGPLLYLYTHALVAGKWPPHGRWHLAPAALQLAYLTLAFVLLRQPFKNQWLARSGFAYDLLIGVGMIVGLAAYGFLGLRLLRRYRDALAQRHSDDHRYAARWLSRATGALLILLPIWTVYGLWDLIDPLGYRGLMGLYVAIAAFALYLSVEGWRHSTLLFPALTPAEMPSGPQRDWRAQGETWAAEVVAARHFADPDISLPGLARRLATNSNYLSRALNEGLGMNFSTFVNRLRCDAVAAAVRQGRSEDLLDLALEAGFSSKASFNRSFRATYAMSPSAYRRRHGSKAEN